uniref:Uncharacterized protein n=1 Tax=Romanomermis culicivorax TaxID=13658 RepID=A0A915HZM9_ROMCU
MPPMECQDESEDPTFAENQSLQDEWEAKSDLTETTPRSTSDRPVMKRKLDDALLKSSSEILQELQSIQWTQGDDDYFAYFLP